MQNNYFNPVTKKKNKIAFGLKFFWLNWLKQDRQTRALNFLNKTYLLHKTISYNDYILKFRKTLLILPEKPYEVMLVQKCIVALKEHRPDMIVDVIAESTNKDIIKSNPYIDNGIFYAAGEFYYNHPAFSELLVVIKDNAYDACFLMKESAGPLDLLLAAATKAILRIGFTGNNVSPFINLSIRPKSGTVYEGDKYEALLKTMGVRMARSKPRWDIPKTTEKDVEGVLVEAGYKIEQSLIGLNVSPSIYGRTFPASTIKEIILELSKKGNAEIILFYSSRKESDIVKELEELKKNIVPIPEDQISFAAAFVYKCDILISLNNLIYQLAVMLNRPVIGLFESEENARWALHQENNVTAERLKGISVEEIVAKADKMLNPARA